MNSYKNLTIVYKRELVVGNNIDLRNRKVNNFEKMCEKSTRTIGCGY